VLDAQCQTPVDALVVSDKARTIIVKDEKNACSKIFCDHVTVLSVSSVNGFLDLEKAMNILYDQGIRSILVEGGGTVILSFLKAGLVDELFVYIGSMIIGGKNTPTMAMGTGFDDEKTVIQLKLINTNHVGDGLLLHYQLKEA
jgi:2,5-diamino-6-(ribosylamino)-4(3H)-pyrimidinone 5'-phosphate reductase